VSTSAAGWISDHFGMRFAFYILAATGLAAVLLAAFAMPETRPTADEEEDARR
jgi:predicted MFS family arabinose efflux permease